MSQPTLDVKQLYQISYQQDSMGIQNYRTPRQYFQVEKEQKQQPKPGKKISYIDQVVKQSLVQIIKQKKVPACNQYIKQKQWPESHPKDPKKIPYPKRVTYIDELIKNSKNPGVGQYSSGKSLEDVSKMLIEEGKKHISKNERPSYLNDVQYGSNIIPGPGQYNPRLSVQKSISIPGNNPKDQITKSKTLEEKQKRLFQTPAPISYTPRYQFETFDNMLLQKDQKKSKSFGTDKRFKEKKNINDIGPGKYKLDVDWKEDKKGYNNIITKGPQTNVYYSKI